MFALKNLGFKVNPSVCYLLSVLLLALFGATLVTFFVEELVFSPVKVEIVAMNSPKSLLQDVYYTPMGGYRFEEGGNYRTLIRICPGTSHAGCRTTWARPLELNSFDNLEVWTIIGGRFKFFSKGDYRLEALVQRYWVQGTYRSIGQYSWSVTVE